MNFAEQADLMETEHRRQCPARTALCALLEHATEEAGANRAAADLLDHPLARERVDVAAQIEELASILAERLSRYEALTAEHVDHLRVLASPDF